TWKSPPSQHLALQVGGFTTVSHVWRRRNKRSARVRPPPPANPSRHCRSRKARKAHATLAPISRKVIANRITLSNGRNFLDRNIKQHCSRKTAEHPNPTLNHPTSSIQNRDRAPTRP